MTGQLYTEDEMRARCADAHFWGWLCRERYDALGSPRSPVPVPFPPEADYEENQAFCFAYWWDTIRRQQHP